MTMNLHFALAVVVVTREKDISEISRMLCSIKADRATGFASQALEEMLAVEEPPEIELGYGAVQSRAVKSISITMRTPGNDFSLVAGFLMTEGVVRDVNEIERIAYAAVDNIDGSAEAGAVQSARVPSPRSVSHDAESALAGQMQSE